MSATCLHTTAVPSSRQQNLGILLFDGEELYQGLEGTFLKWGKDSARQVQCADRASRFSCSEEIRIDALGQHLSGVAQTYYMRQVEAW